MRAVMREFLFLLLAGSAESVVLEKGAQGVALSLGYDDFQALRPAVGESSWRVTASRLQKLRYIAKTWEKGGVRYHLTKLGVDVVSREFVLPPQETSDQEWQLCILAPQEAQKPQHAAARRILTAKGYVNLVPGLYVRLWGGYSGELAQELQHLGFVSCFVPVNPRSAQPASLDSLLYSASLLAAKKNRKLLQFSEDVESLLNELEKKNTLHAKDKQRIGTFVVSGLTILSSIDPLQFVLQSPRPEMLRIVRGVDSLMRRYLQE